MQDGEEEGKEEFAIVFAAMGVNMETAHYFKQVCCCSMRLNQVLAFQGTHGVTVSDMSFLFAVAWTNCSMCIRAVTFYTVLVVCM